MSTLPELSSEALQSILGGNAVCTEQNPSGGPTTFMEQARPAGPSVSQSVIENTDRAMAPWKAFNGIFGGARGPGPNMPAPPRPSYK